MSLYGNEAKFPALLFAVLLTLPDLADSQGTKIVSEEEIQVLLSQRELTFDGERHPYQMRIWAGSETPEGFQHMLFLVERRKGGKPVYRLACDDRYKASAQGDEPVMGSRDCYLDRGADGSIDAEFHQSGKQARKLEESAFYNFTRGKDPEQAMKFASPSEKAWQGYQSILQRLF
jgi:hypothetical protein